MLLGVLAAVAAPVAPPVAALACHLAEPFLAALIAVARWAGAAMPLSGPVRAAPALAVAAALVLACRRARILDARQQVDGLGR
jgi:hypothetical protein